MHRCLRISEVVREIVGYLSRSPETFDAWDVFEHNIGGPDNSSTLLAFALSSKLFLELGLDGLWSCLDSIHPLLNILIPETLEGHVAVTFGQQMNFLWWFHRSADWTKFNYYARRVKGLSINNRDIDERLCCALTSIGHQFPLFPNLRHLNWRNGDVDVLLCLNSFAGPKLTSIDLDLGNWSREWDGRLAPIFSSFNQISPNLRGLTISISEPAVYFYEDTDILNYDNSLPPSDARQMSMILAALPSLQHVKIRSRLFNVALLTLSRMPNLHTLAIEAFLEGMDDDSDSDWTPPPEDAYAWFTTLKFPTLRHLSWGGEAYLGDLSRRLMRVVEDLHGLQSIHISGISCVDPPISIFHDPAFCTTLFSQNFTSISMDFGNHCYNSPPPDSEPKPALQYFRPLLDFKNLEVFEIIWCCSVSWDDDFLHELSIAWPNLRTLVLRGSKEGLSPSRITLSGLKSIAANCPHLKLVEVDAQWTGGSSSLERRYWNHGSDSDSQRSRVVVMVGLGGTDTSGEQQQAIARRFLEDIFPHASITLDTIT